MKSDEDAYDVMIFAETGKWPDHSRDALEKTKDFIRKNPELQRKVPSNQKWFDAEELQELLKRQKRMGTGSGTVGWYVLYAGDRGQKILPGDRERG